MSFYRLKIGSDGFDFAGFESKGSGFVVVFVVVIDLVESLPYMPMISYLHPILQVSLLFVVLLQVVRW